jgi:outer membrane protein assembly factor BamD (BamD/ComL family)
VLTQSERMLYTADSLFHAEDFVHAQMQYDKLARESNNKELAQQAQFMAAYVHLYYKNPFGDWQKALTELEKYKQRYPNGPHINRVLTWMDFLHSLVSYESGYEKTLATSQNLKNQQRFRSQKYMFKDSVIEAQEEKLRYYRHRSTLLEQKVDSLADQIDKLQNTIIELQ